METQTKEILKKNLKTSTLYRHNYFLSLLFKLEILEGILDSHYFWKLKWNEGFSSLQPVDTDNVLILQHKQSQ